jgi:hypothetical protein
MSTSVTKSQTPSSRPRLEPLEDRAVPSAGFQHPASKSEIVQAVAAFNVGQPHPDPSAKWGPYAGSDQPSPPDKLAIVGLAVNTLDSPAVTPSADNGRKADRGGADEGNSSDVALKTEVKHDSPAVTNSEDHAKLHGLVKQLERIVTDLNQVLAAVHSKDKQDSPDGANWDDQDKKQDAKAKLDQVVADLGNSADGLLANAKQDSTVLANAGDQGKAVQANIEKIADDLGNAQDLSLVAQVSAPDVVADLKAVQALDNSAVAAKAVDKKADAVDTAIPSKPEIGPYVRGANESPGGERGPGDTQAPGGKAQGPAAAAGHNGEAGAPVADLGLAAASPVLQGNAGPTAAENGSVNPAETAATLAQAPPLLGREQNPLTPAGFANEPAALAPAAPLNVPLATGLVGGLAVGAEREVGTDSGGIAVSAAGFAPQGAGLSESASWSGDALTAALQHFLDQFGEFRQEALGWLNRLGPMPLGLLGLTLAAVVAELMRRRLDQMRRQAALAECGPTGEYNWLLSLPNDGEGQ